MKRINPTTNKEYALGDLRADGYRFRTYRKNRTDADGFFYMLWMSPESWEKRSKRHTKYIRDYTNRNREFIQQEKLKRGCSDCGYNAHASALDFDHLPSSKKLFSLGAPSARSLDAIKAEMAKCEVVCANCHRIRTATRRERSSSSQ